MRHLRTKVSCTSYQIDILATRPTASEKEKEAYFPPEGGAILGSQKLLALLQEMSDRGNCFDGWAIPSEGIHEIRVSVSSPPHVKTGALVASCLLPSCVSCASDFFFIRRRGIYSNEQKKINVSTVQCTLTTASMA